MDRLFTTLNKKYYERYYGWHQASMVFEDERWLFGFRSLTSLTANEFRSVLDWCENQFGSAVLPEEAEARKGLSSCRRERRWWYSIEDQEELLFIRDQADAVAFRMRWC